MERLTFTATATQMMAQMRSAALQEQKTLAEMQKAGWVYDTLTMRWLHPDFPGREISR